MDITQEIGLAPFEPAAAVEVLYAYGLWTTGIVTDARHEGGDWWTEVTYEADGPQTGVFLTRDIRLPGSRLGPVYCPGWIVGWQTAPSDQARTSLTVAP